MYTCHPKFDIVSASKKERKVNEVSYVYSFIHSLLLSSYLYLCGGICM